MRGSSHRGDRYWEQSGTPEVSDEEKEFFEEQLAEARERCEQVRGRDPADLLNLYYLGAVKGMKSAWDVTVARSYFSGTRAMRRAVGHHRNVLEADPEFTDACQVPGVYDYGIATLPRALRMLAFLFGVRGDKERGLDWLARTAREGERSRWGGLWTYAVFMQREDRLDDALAAIRTLRGQFPKNPDYALEEVRDPPAPRRERRSTRRGTCLHRAAGCRFRELPSDPGRPPGTQAGRVLVVRRELGRGGGRFLTGSRVLSAFRHPGDAALPSRQCPRRHGPAAEGAFRLQPGSADRWGQSDRKLGKEPAQEALARGRPGGVPAALGRERRPRGRIPCLRRSPNGGKTLTRRRYR